MKDEPKIHRGQRKSKTIQIETFSNSDLDPSTVENRALLPSSSRETTPLCEATPAKPEFFDEKAFFSGNPFVEITKGIIHLFKKK